MVKAVKPYPLLATTTQNKAYVTSIEGQILDGSDHIL